MTDKLREAAQMALDALEQVQEADTAGATPKMVMEARKLYEPTITALLAALAQPEQEPVACPYCHYSHTLGAVFFDQNCAGCVKRMTAPPQRERILCGCGDQIMPDDGAECGTCVTARNATQREWQGLTDEDIEDACWTEVDRELRSFARAIEAKLKEKNA